MSELFKLKKWLSLDDAATHLSSVLSNPVTADDLYQFARDGHLMLSVYFSSNTFAHVPDTIPIDEITRDDSGREAPEFSDIVSVNRDKCIEICNERIEAIGGLWHIHIAAASETETARYCHHLTGGAEPKLAQTTNGIIVFSEDGRRFARICTPDREAGSRLCLADFMPKDAAIVVRLVDLRILTASLQEARWKKAIDETYELTFQLSTTIDDEQKSIDQCRKAGKIHTANALQLSLNKFDNLSKKSSIEAVRAIDSLSELDELRAAIIRLNSHVSELESQIQEQGNNPLLEKLPDGIQYAISVYMECWQGLPNDMQRPSKANLEAYIRSLGISENTGINAVIKLSTPDTESLGGKPKQHLIKSWQPQKHRNS